MAKPQQKKDNTAKLARTQANKAKRAARHTARMAEQQLCPKRGLARAMRRFCFSVSREMARVMKRNGYTMSKLVRMPKQARGKQELKLSINGKPMSSLAEAVWTARHLAEERKRDQTHA